MPRVVRLEQFYKVIVGGNNNWRKFSVMKSFRHFFVLLVKKKDTMKRQKGLSWWHKPLEIHLTFKRINKY